jgi:biopolymer transport protein ExbD
MARSVHRSTGMISPNLTPLLDVVLQLITFFMMLVHFGSRLEGTDRMIRLPVAPVALPGSDLTIDRLPVSLDRRGGLRVKGRVLTGREASEWWVQQAGIRRAGLELLQTGRSRSEAGLNIRPVAETELPTIVILSADRDVSYGTVWRTLSEAQERGFARFSLVVLRSSIP